MTEHLPPYQIRTVDGSLSGYGTEVIKALFNVTQEKYTIEVLPWARAYDIACERKYTLIYSMTRSQNRENLFYWVGAINEEQYYFWGLKENFPEPISAIENLRNLSVASATGYASEQYLIKEKFTNIYSVSKEVQIIQMLRRGRVKLILSDGLIFKTLVKQLGYKITDFKAIMQVTELNSKMSIAASKKSSNAFIEKYQQAFIKLEQSGQLSNIKRKWNIAPSEG